MKDEGGRMKHQGATNELKLFRKLGTLQGDFILHPSAFILS